VPGCLVLDVQLPDLNGLDLQQELVKAGVQIPIIFITGRKRVAEQTDCRRIGSKRDHHQSSSS
jgi:FixJ family two-component response regulator